jgi:hypothetical protein
VLRRCLRGWLPATMLMTVSWLPGESGSSPPTMPEAAAQVPQIQDLQLLGLEATRRNLPLLIELTASYCSYCRRLEDELLIPMLIGGDYGEKVIMGKIEVDRYAKLRDFDGRPISADALTRRWHSYVTPTLVFLDPQGRELTEKIVGLTTPELYGGYLDRAIDTALRRLRQPTSEP